MKLSFFLFCTLLIFAAAALRGGEAGVSDETYKNVATFEFSKSRKDVAALEAEIRKMPRDEYKAIEEKLLDALKAPGATVDGKRMICRLLTVVGSAKCVPAMAALLADEQLAHVARMVLEPLNEKSAGEALRKALSQTKGKLRTGVVVSLGMRREDNAVSDLSKLVADDDKDAANAAVVALGDIGNSDAAKALEAAAGTVGETLQRPVAKARITCANLLAKDGKTSQAAAIFKTLLGSKVAPSIPIAALKGVIACADRTDAVKIILEMLQGDDAALRTATLAAYSSSSDKELKDAVAAKLPDMKPAAQAALLGVLSDQPDVAARASVLKVLQNSADDAVRAAALECLATHGTGEDVGVVLKFAIKDDEPGKAAKRVLERMRGAGVNEALAKLLETADAATRGVIVETFAKRKVDTALPVLVKMMNGSDAAAAQEAAKALEKLGTAAEVGPMAALIVSTNDAGTRTAAENAIAAICNRAPDRQPCADALVPALEKAKATAARIALLKLMPRVRTEQALAAVRQAVNDKETEVSEAAARTLADWPELAAAPHLLELAKTTQNQTLAVVALRGCVRLARMKDKPATERAGIVKGILAIAKRPEEKKEALAALGDMASPEALDLLQESLKDEALRADAALAAVRVVKQAGPLLGERAVAVMEQVKTLPGASEDLKKQADEAIKAAKNAGQIDGYIIAWMMAGPYTKEGKGCGELFDIAFDPEKGGNAEWRPVTLPANAGASHLVELDKLIGGQDRVAYLKTVLSSEKDQEVMLEIGSDDGVKVFVNGQSVYGNNATRPCAPGSDKPKIKLKQGANTLLLKITQGGGEWSAICRVRSAAGGAAEGVLVGLK